MKYFKSIWNYFFLIDGDPSRSQYTLYFVLQFFLYLISFLIFLSKSTDCTETSCIQNAKQFLIYYSAIISIISLMVVFINKAIFGKIVPYSRTVHTRQVQNPFLGRGRVSPSGAIDISLDTKTYDRSTTEFGQVITLIILMIIFGTIAFLIVLNAQSYSFLSINLGIDGRALLGYSIISSILFSLVSYRWVGGLLSLICMSGIVSILLYLLVVLVLFIVKSIIG